MVHLPSWNVIFEPKFCKNSIFDHQRPSWILRKMKNSSTCLFLKSSSVTIPTFVQKPYQLLSKSDEPDLNAEPKCNLWGQIWSIFDIWPKATILNFEKNQKKSVGLFLGSSSMSMANLVQIRWTGSELFQKHSFRAPPLLYEFFFFLLWQSSS